MCRSAQFLYHKHAYHGAARPIQSLRILSLRQTIIASEGRYGGGSQRGDSTQGEKMFWLRESCFAACCPFLLQIIIFRGGRSFDFTPPLITARDTSIFAQRSNFTLSLSLFLSPRTNCLFLSPHAAVFCARPLIGSSEPRTNLSSLFTTNFSN